MIFFSLFKLLSKVISNLLIKTMTNNSLITLIKYQYTFDRYLFNYCSHLPVNIKSACPKWKWKRVFLLKNSNYLSQKQTTTSVLKVNNTRTHWITNNRYVAKRGAENCWVHIYMRQVWWLVHISGGFLYSQHRKVTICTDSQDKLKWNRKDKG
jgi:hypothetical protein